MASFTRIARPSPNRLAASNQLITVNNLPRNASQRLLQSISGNGDDDDDGGGGKGEWRIDPARIDPVREREREREKGMDGGREEGDRLLGVP